MNIKLPDRSSPGITHEDIAVITPSLFCSSAYCCAFASLSYYSKLTIFLSRPQNFLQLLVVTKFIKVSDDLGVLSWYDTKLHTKIIKIKEKLQYIFYDQ